MPIVFIAGATGYLGRFLVEEYQRKGWTVRALVRNAQRARAQGLRADELVEAEATKPEELCGVMQGADLVISSLGITRQKDGLTYRAVDYQANLNLLREAERAEVARFAYIHVLGARAMMHVPLVQAKQAFVDQLQCSSIASTIIAPSGYFSDMAEILEMAKSGRAFVFGDGSKKLNPIHGADLAAAVAEAVERGDAWLDIGGPDIFTQRELAELAFDVLDWPAKITRLPDWTRKMALALVPRITPVRVHGPAQFFLTALGQDMVGKPHGTRHVRDHFLRLADEADDRTFKVRRPRRAAPLPH